MSAINVLVQAETVTFITDSAHCDAAGSIRAFGPKVYPVAHWPGAVALVGPLAGVSSEAFEIGLAFDDFSSFEVGAAACVAELARRLGLVAASGTAAASEIALVAIGWRRNVDGPGAFTLSLTSGGELRQTVVDGLFMAHRPSTACLRRHGAEIPSDLGTLNPVLFGTALLSAQREHCDDGHGSGVGGYALFTTVLRSGVFQMRGSEWSDRLGAPITPRAGCLMPSIHYRREPVSRPRQDHLTPLAI
jgi:hypothetical protein